MKTIIQPSRVAQNPQYHSNTKHIDIKYYFVQEKVLDNTFELRYCSTNNMLADMMITGLIHDKFSRLRELLESKICLSMSEKEYKRTCTLDRFHVMCLFIDCTIYRTFFLLYGISCRHVFYKS